MATSYKVHLAYKFQDGKITTSKAVCGRKLYRNERGSHIAKTSEFQGYVSDKENEGSTACCEKCLQIAIESKRIKA